jgi:pimeloyl-ACP methyl ester carboxylesterase
MPCDRVPGSLLKDPVTWLHPPIEPYNSGRLRISVVYEFYFEESGNPSRIRRFPGVMAQGRNDVVCPMESAWALHRAWPESTLIITPDSGHGAFDPPNSRALVAARGKFADSRLSL